MSVQHGNRNRGPAAENGLRRDFGWLFERRQFQPAEPLRCDDRATDPDPLPTAQLHRLGGCDRVLFLGLPAWLIGGAEHRKLPQRITILMAPDARMSRLPERFPRFDWFVGELASFAAACPSAFDAIVTAVACPKDSLACLLSLLPSGGELYFGLSGRAHASLRNLEAQGGELIERIATAHGEWWVMRRKGRARLLPSDRSDLPRRRAG